MRFALIAVLATVASTAHAAPLAEHGVIDLRGAPLGEPVELDGAWAMWADELVPPAEADPTAAPLSVAAAPDSLKVSGCATLALRILVDDDAPLAARVVRPTTAYTIFVGGRVVARGGTPACSAAEADPSGFGGVVALPPTAGVIDVVVHVSAFEDAAPFAGTWTIGDPDEVRAIDARAQGQRWLLLGLFAAVAVVFLGVAAVRVELAPFWLALAALAAALRLASATDVVPPLTSIAPGVDVDVLGPLGFVGALAPLGFLVLVASAVFRSERLVWPTVAVFAVAAIVAGVASLQLGVAIVPAEAIAVYVVLALEAALLLAVLGRAAWHRRDDAALLLVTLAPLLAAAVWPDGLWWLALAVVIAQGLVLLRRMTRGVREVEAEARALQRRHDALARFVPAAFLEQVGRRDPAEAKLGDHVERDMAVLFAEHHIAAESLALVNELLEVIGPAIRDAGGFIAKHLGDGVMALFPDARAAVAAAVKMRAANDELDASRKQPLRIGVGIHTGKLMLGIVGDEQRLAGTVIADAVDTASRIERLTKRFGVTILVSGDVADAIGDHAETRPLGLVRARGGAVPVHEVFDGDAADVAEAKRATREDLERGLVAWREARFKDAVEAFERVSNALPGDTAVRSYLDRARVEARSVPPPGWDGAEDASA